MVVGAAELSVHIPIGLCVVDGVFAKGLQGVLGKTGVFTELWKRP